ASILLIISINIFTSQHLLNLPTHLPNHLQNQLPASFSKPPTAKMQFTSVFTILAIAMTAAAAPAEVVPRAPTIGPKTCSVDDYKPY
ncbi:hypothetical protein OFB58_25555, partial [Escherichia coli]|nr:hypothetical protein [Escherichia coli]